MDPADGQPPKHMTAELDHDGVTWRMGGNPSLQAGSAALFVAIGMSGIALGPYGLALAAFVGLFPLLVFLNAGRQSTVRVTLRRVVIETRGLFGTLTRETVPLDEIRAVKVAPYWARPGVESGDFALVIDTAETWHAIAPRAPRDQLEWLCARVEQARAMFAEHERQEGREWSFLRKVPEDLDLLRERD